MPLSSISLSLMSLSISSSPLASKSSSSVNSVLSSQSNTGNCGKSSFQAKAPPISNLNMHHLYNLFILQKWAIRLIYNLPRFSSTKASFCKLNLLTLNNINKYQILLFMFRYHHSLLPKTINIHFQTGSKIHGHYTRFSHHYRSHYARINTKEFSIHCIGPVLWNNLPEELKILYSINSFKCHLKQFLINN